MKLQLNHKILLLILISICLTIVVSSYIFFTQFYSHIKQYAYDENLHSISRTIKYLNEIEENLKSTSSKITQDKDIQASLRFISTYENIDNYKHEIFDVEKIKLLKYMKNISINNIEVSINVFKTNKQLITTRNLINNQLIQGYSTLVKKNYELVDLYRKKTISNAYFLNTSHLNKIYFQQNTISKKLNLILNKPIYYQNKCVGYVSIKYILDEHSIESFFHQLHSKVSILTDNFKIENYKSDINLDGLDFTKSSTIDNRNYFIHYKPYSIGDKKIYIVATYSKNKLYEHMQTIFTNTALYILIFLFILIFIIKLFVKKNILYPLEQLLSAIKALKNKELKEISIQGHDEISQIATEFSNISQQLHISFETLEQNNIFLNNLLDTLHMSIFMKDINGIYLFVNEQFLIDCQKISKEEVIGKTDFDIYNHKEAQYYRNNDNEIIKTKTAKINHEETQLRQNNIQKTRLISKIPLIDKKYDTVIGILGIYEDITDKKAKEEELKEKEKYLLQQSRLAQMGEMISMIAHQWRQPLTSISTTTSTLIIKSTMNKYNKKLFISKFEDINRYTQYLSSTIDDFRNFFKKNKEKTDIVVETIIKDCLGIIGSSLGNNNINVITNYRSHKILHTYPNEIRQVILNILKNAEDILVEKDIVDKWITIDTYNDENQCIIEINDNGEGIDQKIIDKIFEPYFSTKHNKNGTGLGLYMSKTIIEDNCGGKLFVSNNKFGAVFKVVI